MTRNHWILIVLSVVFLRPSLLEDVAILARLARAIVARLILDFWLKGGNAVGTITRPLHRWLRAEANGRTHAWLERWSARLDIPGQEAKE